MSSFEAPDGLPSISVVVPVYNGEATIAACVESLLKLDYPAERLEIAVVDNRSGDGTREVVRRHPVRLLEERVLQSSYAARNHGIARTSGSIVAFTDADCVVERGWLRAIARAIAPPEVGGVAGAIHPLRVASPIERYQAGRCIRADRAFAHPVLPFAQTANAAYERALLERLGGFDASLVSGGDLDLSWRMQREAGLGLAYEPCALVWHQHRSTSRDLFRLYVKNAIGNCLLGRHYAHYAPFTELRTLLYLAREASRSGARAAYRRLRRREPAHDDYFDAVRFAGAAWGWVRWRAARARGPRLAVAPPVVDLERT